MRSCLKLIKYIKVTSCSQVKDCVLLKDSLLKATFYESFSLHFTFSMRCAQLSAKLGAPKMEIIFADVPVSQNEDFSLFNIFKYLRSIKRQNEVQQLIANVKRSAHIYLSRTLLRGM